MLTFVEIFVLTVAAAVMVGCQSISAQQTAGTIPPREMQAIKSAAKAYTGKDVSDEEIYRIANQLQENAQSQSAIESVTSTLIQKPIIFYCPIDGKRFSPSVKECPEHHVDLRLVE